MNQQRGLSLSSLLVWCVVIVLVVTTAMKVVPSLIEYQAVLKTVKTVAAEATEGVTVSDLKASFKKYAEVNNFSSVTANDLVISKEGGKVVISFSYEKKIPLFWNASLLIDYNGSSS